MSFKVLFSDQADKKMDYMESTPGQKKHLKAVNKALYYLEENPKHPSLNTHKYTLLEGPNGQEIFEAYAENKTPAAYRIFWYYGQNKKEITILAITTHP